jgi:hypothetical protein
VVLGEDTVGRNAKIASLLADRREDDEREIFQAGMTRRLIWGPKSQVQRFGRRPWEAPSLPRVPHDVPPGKNGLLRIGTSTWRLPTVLFLDDCPMATFLIPSSILYFHPYMSMHTLHMYEDCRWHHLDSLQFDLLTIATISNTLR